MLREKFEYVRLKHKETGQEIMIDSKKGYYDRIAKGFLNSVKLRPHFIKHIILTQAKESYKPRILHSFLVALKKRYGNVVYIWTVELQEKRFHTTGEAVLHWHIIVAFPYEIGIGFGREDIEKIQRYWKYGHVKVVPVRKLNLGYLMKYLEKELSQDIGLSTLFEGVRRIGTSKISPWLKQGFPSVLAVMSWFAVVGQDINSFHWYKGSAYVYEDARYKRGRLYVYKRKKEWEYVDGSNGEPF